nr:anaphase-promoting complex subunit 4-like [Leptinotarsa decemlineata]
MTSFQTIKQLEEKSVANEINSMVWSDRMDLVAFSNVKGEVALHRLSWTKAWNLNPPKENVEVKAIAWRPDGKILAVGYSSGEVLLISVENKKTLNVKDASSEITCITWVQEKGETTDKDNFTIQDDGKMDYMKYIDLSKLYLKDPISSSTMDSPSSTEEAKETNFLQEQTEFNLLLIGTKNGFIHIRIFGCFTCCILNVNEYLGRSCSIEGIHVSEDISKIFVTVKDSDLNIKIVLINANILKTHTRELFSIAIKYVKLLDIVSYLTNTITNITETWESFLLEIDHKLSKYAKKVPEGGVTADFLDLLTFGICSPELQEFLMTDLTKKGLEKFGQTVEMSYANIQRLLLKNVSKFGQNVSYHLAELRGMSRLEDRYEVLGLSEHQVTEAIQSSGAFLLKSGEMQQIINHSVVNYKAFFRWLYGAILFLMDETIPSEIHKMAQQDLAYITEFLQNFDNIGNKDGNNKKGFVMERLGQYLVDAPLTLTPNMEGNDWTTFLNENECVGNHPSIFKYYANTSLIQQFKDLAVKITNIFDSPKGILPNQFRHVHTFDCFNFKQNMLRITSVNVNKEMVLFGILEPFCHLHLLQIHVTEERCLARCGKFYFTDLTEESDQMYQILDVSFYSINILSLLIQDIHGYKTATLLQLPLPPALEKLTEIDINVALNRAVLSNTNGSTFVPKLFKNVDMAASSFAVSGNRRVGIVLSENKRKVKLFEMEAEDEDEEDADMTSSVLKEDVSMQDSHIID